MLPSRPKIQPVKGGANRDPVSAGWGNGILSELHLPQERVYFDYQEVGPIEVDGRKVTFESVFAKSYSDFGPNSFHASGSVMEQGQASELLLSCDSFYSYLVNEEQLSTEDWTTLKSVHGDWLREPVPVVTVNGAIISESGYSVDFGNGSIIFPQKIRGSAYLVSQAQAGAMSIIVDDVAGFSPGDMAILKGETTSQDEAVIVQSVVLPNTITLSGALSFSHATGKQVEEMAPVVRATYRYIEQHLSLYEFNPPSPAGPQAMMPAMSHEFCETGDTGLGILRLKNPIFDSWTGSMPDGWATGGLGALQTAKGQGILGDFSLRLTATPNTGWSYCHQTHPGTHSGNITFSCWVRTDQTAKIEIVPSGAPAVSTYLDCRAGQAAEAFKDKWVRLSVSVQGQGPFEVKLYAQLAQNDGGTASFDGCCLLVK
ncbi:MAG TPA: hypothetical protein PLX04_06060 [Caldisericia bacterium]|nr:hypothetical protein [Caldisericia bacterium]